MQRKINVWFADTVRPDQHDFTVKEIVYSYNSQWKVRNITLRHQHPAEYIAQPNPAPSGLKTYKFMLDLYYDDFGTFRNTYHSLGGVYLQFCNMPLHQRQKL